MRLVTFYIFLIDKKGRQISKTAMNWSAYKYCLCIQNTHAGGLFYSKTSHCSKYTLEYQRCISPKMKIVPNKCTSLHTILNLLKTTVLSCFTKWQVHFSYVVQKDHGDMLFLKLPGQEIDSQIKNWNYPEILIGSPVTVDISFLHSLSLSLSAAWRVWAGGHGGPGRGNAWARGGNIWWHPAGNWPTWHKAHTFAIH